MQSANQYRSPVTANLPGMASPISNAESLWRGGNTGDIINFLTPLRNAAISNRTNESIRAQQPQLDLSRYQFDKDYGLRAAEGTLNYLNFGEGTRRFDLGHGLNRDRFGEEKRQFDLDYGLRSKGADEGTRRYDLDRGDTNAYRHDQLGLGYLGIGPDYLNAIGNFMRFLQP